MTVTGALRAADPMTGDRDPIAIAPRTAPPIGLPTGLPTGHIEAAGRPTSPDLARRVQRPMKAA